MGAMRKKAMGTYENGAGVNFDFFSRHASRAELQLFERPADAMPFRVIALDPASNCTGDVWHVWVEGIRPGQLYAYRVPLIRERICQGLALLGIELNNARNADTAGVISADAGRVTVR